MLVTAAAVAAVTVGTSAAATSAPPPVPPGPLGLTGPLGPPGPIPALPLPGTPAPPDRDPFYRASGSLASADPGDVLRSRRIAALSPTALTGTRTYQLLYRTTDTSGEPIATVATLLLPNVPAPGPRKLVSYHPAEDSLTTRCAPSYTLRTGSGSTQAPESAVIAALLARGWTVVVPDYEGPRSEFAVGPLEGQAALDGVRAAERFAPAGLDGDHTPVALMGYSGGSIPTMWASGLAPRYAPELNIVGTAAGGVAASLRQSVPSLDGGPFAGAIVAASVGIDRAYPDFDLGSLLNSRGRALAARDARDADGCSIALVNAPGARISQLTHYPDAAALLAVPRVARALDDVDLVQGPGPSAPAYLYHEVNDEILIIKPVDQYVRKNCEDGARIEYHRNPVGEHGSGAVAFQLPAMQYLADRFAGRRAPDTCPNPG